MLNAAIKEIFICSRNRYGAPKIQKALAAQGNNVSIKCVQRHMSEMGLKSIVIRKWNHYSANNKVEEKENIIKQDFSAENINEKWCTDITYIYTVQDGWTYLASVMDCYSKKIIGWSYSKSMTTEMALDAVKKAILNVKPSGKIILHSDLGSQYTSRLFEAYLAERNIVHSFSRKGCPYDNACIESFHSILKKEEIHHKKYHDFKEAYNAIFEYIESWYNRKRIHSSIGYLTPDAVHKAAFVRI